MSHELEFNLYRSMLCVPASNLKALAKSVHLNCDAIIFDLEDAVALNAKQTARENLRTHFAQNAAGHAKRLVRINDLNSPFGAKDIALSVDLEPDAIILPKVEDPNDVHAVADVLTKTERNDIRLWAMIETPKGVLNAAAIARAAHTKEAKLDGFIVGLNDLRKAARIPYNLDRSYLHPWLMQIVLAARAYHLCVIDAVFNDFKQIEALRNECTEGRNMGFDGKMLIHPAQIEPANDAFGPQADDLTEAKAIIAAFEAPEAADQGAINLNGKMVERLHLDDAVALVQQAAMIEKRK